MKKYLIIFSTTIKEYFAYRLNFILWRLRMFLSVLVIFFVWDSVFDKTQAFGHYQKAALLSYIIFANIIGNFVLGTRTIDVAGDINNGNIINLLLKPVSFFKFYLTRDLADKFINLVFVILEMVFLIYLFKVDIVMPKNLFWASFFLILGALISFYINLCLSFIAFWTTEVWAPRFLFFVLVFFVAGSYFPLDLLPVPIYRLILLTPFPYLFYLPTKLMVSQQELKFDFLFYEHIALALFWLWASSKLTHRLWTIGNKSFSFWGR